MDDILYALKLRDESEDGELIFELLSALELDYSSYEDREGGGSYIMVYSESPEAFSSDRDRLKKAAAEWSRYGLKLVDFQELTVKREEWSEVWKKYFHIIRISDNLVIRPSWLEYEARGGEAVVRIDPGMSFGTGQHATTAFCLRKLGENAGRPGVTSVLDAGCGSGILAVAAALLGYGRVDAFDYDPEAVAVAAENIKLNGVAGKIGLFQADVGAYDPPVDLPEGYDLALVNILSHVLAANAPRIVRLVRTGGLLCLAGILTGEFDELSGLFRRNNCEELERFTEKEWTSGLFRRLR